MSRWLSNRIISIFNLTAQRITEAWGNGIIHPYCSKFLKKELLKDIRKLLFYKLFAGWTYAYGATLCARQITIYRFGSKSIGLRLFIILTGVPNLEVLPQTFSVIVSAYTHVLWTFQEIFSSFNQIIFFTIDWWGLMKWTKRRKFPKK